MQHASIATVVAAGDVILLCQGETLIFCNVITDDVLPTTTLFEPNPNLSKGEFLAAKAVVNPPNKQIPVRLLNPHRHDKLLYENQIIGHLESEFEIPLFQQVNSTSQPAPTSYPHDKVMQQILKELDFSTVELDSFQQHELIQLIYEYKDVFCHH